MEKLKLDKLKKLWETPKRRIATVAGIVIVLCILLSTCGKKGGEHARLLEMLENGEYQSAHYYIDDLQRKEMEEGKTDEKKESQIARLYGEWTLTSSYGNEDAFETVSFGKDSSCQIGKDTLKWRITDEQDTYISLDVTDGEKKAYRVSLNMGNKEISVSLSQYEDENGATKSIGEYKNLALYDAIEITTENWDEYFEITDEGKFSENAFGEVESFTYYQYLSLKDEYIDKFSSSLTKKVVMELDFTYGKKDCQVDLANKKYTILDGYEVNAYDRDSSNYQFTYTSNEDKASYYTTLMSCYYNQENGYLSDYGTDMEVIRVLGTIYLLK